MRRWRLEWSEVADEVEEKRLENMGALEKHCRFWVSVLR